MFTWKRRTQRGAMYGTYHWKDPISAARGLYTCKDFCAKHGYSVSFTQIALEWEGTTSQDESMELRSLIQDIKQDKLDIVLFVDFNWIRRKPPEQLECLLNTAAAHSTTLIDVSTEQVIT